MKLFTRFIPIFLIFFGLEAYALRNKIGKQVAASLKAELSAIDKRLSKSHMNKNDKESHYDYGDSRLYLGTIKIRIRPFVTIKLPGIASLRIRPRFALHWKRKPPKGWIKYSR